MAQPPVLIGEVGEFSDVSVYTVPGSQTIQPTSVSAVFDGASASASWQPTLSFYAQSGELIARQFPQGVTLASGETAECTFAPFLDRGAAAAAGGAFPPYLPYDIDFILRNEDSPASAGGSTWLTIPLADGAPLSGLGALFGVVELTLTDPGTSLPAAVSFYTFSPTQYIDSSKQSEVTIFGAGVTYPAGIPYQAFLRDAGSPYASVTVPGVTDPDFALNFNQARPTWPGMYAPGDILFSGFWSVALRNE